MITQTVSKEKNRRERSAGFSPKVFEGKDRQKKQIDKTGRKVARTITVGMTVIFLMVSVVAGLRTYAGSLEVQSIRTKNEIKKIDQRIEELNGEINIRYTNSLIIDDPKQTKVTDNCFFIPDLWEVGG
ncbi:hypothetical protein KKB99_00240 [bacterium]|nr:hypothetical protein [bacterium]MBU1024413.1 hypothetical protein [bacterium]